MKTSLAWICGLLLLFTAAAARADVVTYFPVSCGDDEREDAGGLCPQEPKFYAGTVSTALHLKVGGDTAGCDSEWATSLEFVLSPLPRAVVAAILVVRKTGYSDDSQGFAYISAFAYHATGAVETIERVNLTPETALSIVYPTAANVDLHFDVTAAVQSLSSNGESRAGFLLAGVYSEVGYEDWISVGGTTYTVPPRLVVEFERPITTRPLTWSWVRSLYR